MILRELLVIAAGNVWRTRLRAGLTMVGVAVGIGALVSMFSFALGMQRAVTDQFEKMGLFRTFQVLPPGEGAERLLDRRGGDGPSPPPDSSTTVAPPLDQAALERIRALEGVRIAYPQQTFDAEFRLRSQKGKGALQALPASYMEGGPRDGLLAGDVFHADSDSVAVLSAEWVQSLGMDPDSVLGDTLRVRVAGSGEILLAVGRRVVEPLGIPRRLVDLGERLASTAYRRLRSNELRVRVIGVAEFGEAFGFRMGDVVVPTDLARNLDYLPFSNPLELVSLLSEPRGGGYPMLIVVVAGEEDYEKVRGAVEAMGFKVFSFVDQFTEMRKQFLLFDAFVAALGSIALFVAALGIVNTMVMSILERTREIGILKSLGAEEEQIRLLFLVESGLIGLAGSLGGLLLGFGFSRLASLLMRAWMVRQHGPDIDPFHFPIWLALSGLAFGVLLSIAAGIYPAGRASRVDPVEALRHD